MTDEGETELTLGMQRVNQDLAKMREQTGTGPLTPEVDFGTGLRLHSDPTLNLDGQYRTPEGWLLEIDATITGTGGWCTLYLPLPCHALSPEAVLGFTARAAATEQIMLRACLRSGQGSGFVDTFFDRHLLLRPEETVHVDALHLQRHPEVPTEAPWRDLMFFLPTRSFHATLMDLRVFLV